jgi:hypothetical protein
MNPQQILSSFRETLGAKVLEDHTIERNVGTLDPKPVYDLWLVVDRGGFHDAVAHLCAEFNPHLTVISGDDLGDDIDSNRRPEERLSASDHLRPPSRSADLGAGEARVFRPGSRGASR